MSCYLLSERYLEKICPILSVGLSERASERWKRTRWDGAEQEGVKIGGGQRRGMILCEPYIQHSTVQYISYEPVTRSGIRSLGGACLAVRRTVVVRPTFTVPQDVSTMRSAAMRYERVGEGLAFRRLIHEKSLAWART